MRMEEAFYNISMYLYNENVLEYAQIARSGPKSMIRVIEGRSRIFNLENVISIFIKNLVNVAMRMEEAFYTISI